MYSGLLTCGSTYIVYQCCAFTQTIPKATHTKTHTGEQDTRPRLIAHARNPLTHTHLPVDCGSRRTNPAAATVVRCSSRISTETRAWLLSDPARLSSSGKKNAARRRRGRESEGGRTRKRGRGPMVWSWSRVGIFNNKH